MSVFGLVDLLSILPFWTEVLLRFAGVEIDAFAFRVLRLFRVLALEHFDGATQTLHSVWRKSRSSLGATGILGLIVWILGACLFYLFEKDNPRMGGAFGTIPDSMYYAGIFLGGDWEKFDFTPEGKILCVFYCVIGVGIFAIPIGAIFEAFRTVLGGED